MTDFLILNALGFFSLIILSIIFWQAKSYLENNDKKLKAVWLSAISSAFLVQLFDILNRLLLRLPDQTSVAPFSYVVAIILSNVVVIMSTHIARFIDYITDPSDEVYNFFRRQFRWIIIINALLSLAAVRFDSFALAAPVSDYAYIILFFSTPVLTLVPILMVLMRMMFHSRKKVKKVLIITGFIFPLALLYLQVSGLSPVPVVFPSVTTFILILNSILTLNSMYVDYLTGVSNTRGVDKYFGDLPQSLHTFLAVAFIDLNNFKKINDTFGHREGDHTLCNFAKILSASVRNEDLVARIGGDEFLLAALVKQPKDIDAILSRLSERIEQYNMTAGKEYCMSVSCGVCIVPPGGRIDKDKILEEADSRMYKQKSTAFQGKLHWDKQENSTPATTG